MGFAGWSRASDYDRSLFRQNAVFSYNALQWIFRSGTFDREARKKLFLFYSNIPLLSRFVSGCVTEPTDNQAER